MAELKVYIEELTEIRRVGGDAAYLVKVVSPYEEKLRSGGEAAQRTTRFLQDAWVGSDVALEQAFMIHVAKFLPAHDWEELQKTKKKWATERKSGTGQVHEGRATVQMGAASVVAALYYKAATLIQ